MATKTKNVVGNTDPATICGKKNPIRKLIVHSTKTQMPMPMPADMHREDLGHRQPGDGPMQPCWKARKVTMNSSTR